MTFSQHVTEVWTPDRWNNQQKHCNHHHLLNNEIWWFDEHRHVLTSTRHKNIVFGEKKTSTFSSHLYVLPRSGSHLQWMASPPKKDLFAFWLRQWGIEHIERHNSCPNHTPKNKEKQSRMYQSYLSYCIKLTWALLAHLIQKTKTKKGNPKTRKHKSIQKLFPTTKGWTVHWVSLYLCQLPTWNTNSKSQVVLEVLDGLCWS